MGSAIKTESLLERIERYRNSYEEFAKDCIFIQDHTTQSIQPLVFNRAQRILNNIAEKCKREFGRIMLIIDKSRRVGVSTWVEGKAYHRCSLNFNQNALICAHQEKSTATLFRMAKLMHQRNPLKPDTLASNAQELIFDNKEGTGFKSRYSLATAANTESGRSEGAQIIHHSEEAFFADGHTLLGAVRQLLPHHGFVEHYRESTGNGFGNSFQEDAFKAYAEGEHPFYEEEGVTFAWKCPGFDYIVVVLPWFIDENCTRNFDSEEQKAEFESYINQKVFDKERSEWVESELSQIRKKYGLTLEQLYFYDWALENLCRGDESLRKQEYPTTIHDSFRKAGGDVFSKTICDMADESCLEPILLCDPVERFGVPKFKRNPNGKMKVWEPPYEGKRYLMVIDAAGGIRNEDKPEPDPTCIDVWRIGKLCHQVAVWHGHIDYDLIGELALKIGEIYNMALGVVEMQNHGWTVIADLKRQSYPMYSSDEKNPGWSTDRASKPLMVDGLRIGVRDGWMQVRDKATVAEMRTYLEKKNRQYESASGCHDERVDTAGMAAVVFQRTPRVLEDLKDVPMSFGNWDNRSAELRKRERREVEVYQT